MKTLCWLFLALVAFSCVFGTIFSQPSSPSVLPGLESHPLPTNVKPFTKVDIRVNYRPNDHAAKSPYDPEGEFYAQAAFASLSDVNTLEVETLSTTPPVDATDRSFIPFGRHIRFAFSIATDGEHVDGNSPTTNDYLFVLRVDETVVSLDPTSSTQLESLSEAGEGAVAYSKRVTYSGEQLNADGSIDKAFLTILSNSGDWDALYRNPNGGLETQSGDRRPMKPESLSAQSGRHDNGYTIEGMILKPDGTMIQITSYSSLLLQQLGLKTALQEQSDQMLMTESSLRSPTFTEQSFKIQSKMNELDDLMETLYDQQQNAAYDLSFSEVKTADFKCGGGIEHQQSHSDNDAEIHRSVDEVLTPSGEPGSPLNMVSQWVLSRWTGCHNNMNKRATVFPIRYVASTTFQVWASNLNWSAGAVVNAGLVDARIQYAMTVMNFIFSQQLDVALSIHSTRLLTKSEQTSTFNPQSLACDVPSILTSFTNWAYDNRAAEITSKGALIHLLLMCTDLNPADPTESGGTAGVAWTGAVCGDAFLATVNGVGNTKVVHGGVSSFSFAQLMSWTTLIHELGHNFGAPSFPLTLVEHWVFLLLLLLAFPLSVLDEPELFSPLILPSSFTHYLITLDFVLNSITISKCRWGSVAANQGKIGGIMDYGSSLLAPTIGVIGDRTRFGFNQATEFTPVCTKINALVAAGNYGANACMLDLPGTAVTTMNLYTANGVLDPYEQCDGSDPNPFPSANPVTCCNNGRFTTQDANCAYQNECCNSSCQALPATTACSLTAADTAKMGVCNLGQCVPVCLEVSCGAGATVGTTWAVPAPANSCQTQCKWDCVGTSQSWTQLREVMFGSTCGGTPGAPHHCITTATNLVARDNLYTCTAPVAGSYTWVQRVVRDCSDTLNIIDAYLCHDPAGFVVGDNFCSSTRPVPPQTCAVKGSYTVTVPTDTRQVGTAMTVSWVYSGSHAYNKVDVVYYLGSVATVVSTNIDVLLGSLSVIIPSSSAAGTAKWRVRRAGSTTVFGESLTFQVAVPTQTISTPTLSGTTAGSQSTLSFSVGAFAANSCTFQYFAASSAAGVTLTTSPSGNFDVGTHAVTFTIPNTVISSAAAYILITSGSITAQSAPFVLTKFNYQTVYTPATCPTGRCSSSIQTASLTCIKTTGIGLSTEPTNTNCGTPPTITNNTCQATFSCGANGSCQASGTTCTCTNGWSGSSCTTAPGTITVGSITGTTAGTQSSLPIQVAASAVTVTEVRYIATGPTAVDIPLTFSPTTQLAVGARTITFTIPAGTDPSPSGRIRVTVNGSWIDSAAFSLTTFKYAPVWTPAACPSRCSASTQVGSQACMRYAGSAAGVSAEISDCGSQTVPAAPSPQQCAASFSCGANGSCATSGTTCVCTNGFTGQTCTTAPSITGNVELIPTSATTPVLTAVDSGSSFRVRFTFAGSSTAVQLHIMSSNLVDTTQTVVTHTATNGSNLVTFKLGSLTTRTNAVVRVQVVGSTAVTLSSGPFTIYTYNWVANRGAMSPASCPTNNCSPVPRTQAAGCVRYAGTVETVSTGCSGSAPAATSITACPTTITSCNNGSCANRLCSCDVNWSGPSCDVSTVITNVQITSPTADVAIGTTELSVSWTAVGPSSTLDLIYKLQAGSNNNIIVLKQVASTGSPATVVLPFGTSPSAQAVVGVRVANAGSNSEGTPILNAIAFDWVQGEWSECSTKTCASGTQFRANKCRSSNNVIATADFCNAETKQPTGTQVCLNDEGCGANGVCDQSSDTCTCSTGFTGANCLGSLDCTSSLCANGGTILVDPDTNTCATSCTCPNSWITPQSIPSPPTSTQQGCGECSLTCTTPSLQKDPNTPTGVALDDCSQCKCNRGFFSTQCGCRELYITLPFRVFPSVFASSNAIAASGSDRLETMEQYKEQKDLLASLEGLIGTLLSTDRVAVSWWFINEEKILQVTTTLRLECQSETNPMLLQSSIEKLFATLAFNHHETYEKVQAWIKSLAPSSQPIPGFEFDSDLEFAKMLYDPSCSSTDFDSSSTHSCDSASKESPFTSVDGTTEPGPEDEKKDKTWIIIVAASVGGGALLLLIVLILVCFCCGCCCFSGSSNDSEKQHKKQQHEKEKQQKKEEKEQQRQQKRGTEMSSPEPYTANPMNSAPQAASAPSAPISPQAPRAPGAPHQMSPPASRPPQSPTFPSAPMSPQAPRAPGAPPASRPPQSPTAPTAPGAPQPRY